jgi:hypothetical protein
MRGGTRLKLFKSLMTRKGGAKLIATPSLFRRISQNGPTQIAEEEALQAIRTEHASVYS